MLRVTSGKNPVIECPYSLRVPSIEAAALRSLVGRCALRLISPTGIRHAIPRDRMPTGAHAIQTLPLPYTAGFCKGSKRKRTGTSTVHNTTRTARPRETRRVSEACMNLPCSRCGLPTGRILFFECLYSLCVLGIEAVALRSTVGRCALRLISPTGIRHAIRWDRKPTAHVPF